MRVKDTGQALKNLRDENAQPGQERLFQRQRKSISKKLFKKKVNEAYQEGNATTGI